MGGVLWVDLFHYLLYVINSIHRIVDPFPAGGQLWRKEGGGGEKKQMSSTAAAVVIVHVKKKRHLSYQHEK